MKLDKQFTFNIVGSGRPAVYEPMYGIRFKLEIDQFGKEARVIRNCRLGYTHLHSFGSKGHADNNLGEVPLYNSEHEALLLNMLIEGVEFFEDDPEKIRDTEEAVENAVNRIGTLCLWLMTNFEV